MTFQFRNLDHVYNSPAFQTQHDARRNSGVDPCHEFALSLRAEDDNPWIAPMSWGRKDKFARQEVAGQVVPQMMHAWLSRYDSHRANFRTIDRTYAAHPGQAQILRASAAEGVANGSSFAGVYAT